MMELTAKSKFFVQLVFSYNALKNLEVEEKLLQLLEQEASGLEDCNEILTKFGDLYNFREAICGDSKVALAQALTVYANYDVYQNMVYVHERDFYKDVILNILVEIVDGVSLDEAYCRLGAFIPA